jgi:hypothetical protein
VEVILAVEATAEPTRRDMLFIATGAAAVVGLGSIAWPLNLFVPPYTFVSDTKVTIG